MPSENPGSEPTNPQTEVAALRAELRRVSDQARFLESIIEHLPSMVFVKDAEALRFVRFNGAGQSIVGFSETTLIGKSDRDFFPPAEAEFFIAKDREVLEQGGILDIPEEPIHTATGLRILHTRKIPLYDAEGKPAFLLGISEDITEKKHAEQQLRLLLQHFPGVMWTTDPDLRMLSTAGSAAAALGLLNVEVQGRAVDTALPTPNEGDTLALHAAARAGQVVDYAMAVGQRTFEARLEPFAGGVIGVALDVTERRRAEAAQMRERLERAQKMEMLGLLAGGIAHDFNNLLTVILGNASLALMRMPEGEARTPIERVQRSAQTAADLTRQLLAYSGRGHFVVGKLDLSTLVHEMGALFRISVPRTITLKFALEPGLPPCEADATQIRQVLINLIANAADAIGQAQGTITLATGLVCADRDYLARAWLDEALPAGHYIWLEVSDTGCGMDQTTQNQMFDPFFTTKTKGHGLGLSATLGIVRSHRGAIRVYSEPGRGSAIRVLFPASDGTAALAEPEASPVACAQHARVLIVDDEPEIRVFAKDVLSGAGYSVEVAPDGLVAVDIVSRDRSFDVVVLDMTMPHLSGEGTFKELRRLCPELRILVSSGYTEQEATARLVGRRRSGFLQKPYTAAELLDRVRTLLKA